jgi:hypothetical protein
MNASPKTGFGATPSFGERERLGMTGRRGHFARLPRALISVVRLRSSRSERTAAPAAALDPGTVLCGQTVTYYFAGFTPARREESVRKVGTVSSLGGIWAGAVTRWFTSTRRKLSCG